MSKTIDLICILDKSGSMRSLAEKVRENFNTLVQEYQSSENNVKLTLVTFDSTSTTIIDREAIDEVKPITEEDYKPLGTTAMLDAIGKTIIGFDKINKREVIVMIHTDGAENSSTIFNLDSIKYIIEVQQERGWDFHFAGANIDAVGIASRLSIGPENTISFKSTPDGMDQLYTKSSIAIRSSVDKYTG